MLSYPVHVQQQGEDRTREVVGEVCYQEREVKKEIMMEYFLWMRRNHVTSDSLLTGRTSAP
jgi:hypothetical protein